MFKLEYLRVKARDRGPECGEVDLTVIPTFVLDLSKFYIYCVLVISGDQECTAMPNVASTHPRYAWSFSTPTLTSTFIGSLSTQS